MGVSRIWNGSTANYLNAAGNGTAGGLSAMCAWISVDALGVLGTIFGNRFDAGYAMQINASDELQLSFQESGVIYYLTAPLTIAGGASQDFLQAGVPLFVAINVTNSNPFVQPVTADFYAGLTPSDVEFIGSDSAGSFIAPNFTQPVLIGANNFGAAADAFDGALQRIGRWTVNLTLAEIEAVASCGGTLPQSGSCAFFFEITGADPEPNTGTGTDASVVGSLPLGPDLCFVVAAENFAMII